MEFESTAVLGGAKDERFALSVLAVRAMIASISDERDERLSTLRVAVRGSAPRFASACSARLGLRVLDSACARRGWPSASSE